MTQGKSHLGMINSSEPCSGLKWSSFQMTVQSNYEIAIVTLNDWLKVLRQFFNQ